MHHLTDVPFHETNTKLIAADLVQNSGKGTENEPFRVYRHGSSSQTENLKRVRFVCMSDTHNEIHRITIPDGDVFVHCGDAVNHSTSSRDIRVFNEFVGKLPHRYKLFVSGNHCVCLNPKRPERNHKILSNMTYLQDDLIDIEGVKIYGSPWRPARGCFYRAEAFGYDLKRIRRDKWSKIPENIDFLLTHCPPYSIRDYNCSSEEPLGCPDLLDEVVNRVRPRIHLFGHMHSCHGASLYRRADNVALEAEGQTSTDDDNILFVNLAIHQGRRLAEPIVIDYFY